MGITKDQWGEIETHLSYAFGCAKLTCDGYEVTLQVVSVNTLQYGIMVYVNGLFNGKWLIEDCEERRRFLRPTQRFLWSAKERVAMLKIYGGKRAQKKDVERINRKITWYSSHWTSVKSLRRHLEKNNRELEVVSIGGVEVAQATASPGSVHELAA